MRVTNNMNAYNSLTSVQSGMNTFYKINQQLNSGYQISNSYEGANTYIDSARLEYEIQTLEQVEKAASMASEMMKNTDSALEQMVSLISQFQVKVTQAVNATQSQTSREAIAKELTRIKEEIVNLANTSVNGQYLFSGSLTNTKPFDIYGNYFGNQEDLNIVTGDRTTNSYNIPGYDLFFKPDNDFYKQITTNVSFTDNRYNLVDNPDKTRYLTASDSFKNLVGLNYFEDNAWLDPKKHFEDEPLDLPPTVLYVQGKRPDGTSFKSSVLVEPDDTLQSMFDKIGAVYGNTSTNKVVDISINESGQIQIKDLKQGRTVTGYVFAEYIDLTGDTSSSGEGDSSSDISFTDDEVELLAALVYCEAGNQSYEGKLAVANVVLNRLNSSQFPNTIKDVIYQKNQFSPASSGALERALNNGVPSDCVKAAKDAMSGNNNVEGFLFFNTVVNTDSVADYIQIGDHIFYHY